MIYIFSALKISLVIFLRGIFLQTLEMKTNEQMNSDLSDKTCIPPNDPDINEKIKKSLIISHYQPILGNFNHIIDNSKAEAEDITPSICNSELEKSSCVDISLELKLEQETTPNVLNRQPEGNLEDCGSREDEIKKCVANISKPWLSCKDGSENSKRMQIIISKANIDYKKLFQSVLHEYSDEISENPIYYGKKMPKANMSPMDIHSLEEKESPLDLIKTPSKKKDDKNTQGPENDNSELKNLSQSLLATKIQEELKKIDSLENLMIRGQRFESEPKISLNRGFHHQNVTVCDLKDIVSIDIQDMRVDLNLKKKIYESLELLSYLFYQKNTKIPLKHANKLFDALASNSSSFSWTLQMNSTHGDSKNSKRLDQSKSKKTISYTSDSQMFIGEKVKTYDTILSPSTSDMNYAKNIESDGINELMQDIMEQSPEILFLNTSSLIQDEPFENKSPQPPSKRKGNLFCFEITSYISNSSKETYLSTKNNLKYNIENGLEVMSVECNERILEKSIKSRDSNRNDLDKTTLPDLYSFGDTNLESQDGMNFIECVVHENPQEQETDFSSEKTIKTGKLDNSKVNTIPSVSISRGLPSYHKTSHVTAVLQVLKNCSTLQNFLKLQFNPHSLSMQALKNIFEFMNDDHEINCQDHEDEKETEELFIKNYELIMGQLFEKSDAKMKRALKDSDPSAFLVIILTEISFFSKISDGEEQGPPFFHYVRDLNENSSYGASTHILPGKNVYFTIHLNEGSLHETLQKLIYRMNAQKSDYKVRPWYSCIHSKKTYRDSLVGILPDLLILKIESKSHKSIKKSLTPISIDGKLVLENSSGFLERYVLRAVLFRKKQLTHAMINFNDKWLSYFNSERWEQSNPFEFMKENISSVNIIFYERENS